MSAHAIVTAIEEEARAFCRSRMTGRADQDLDAKDAHCKRIAALVRQLRPQLGTVEKRTFGQNGTSTKGVPFTVARRRRTARPAA
ncbi:hypothetical protein ABIE45_002792 [Methylobacterium sp. OAE515]|uniref:hypothetical protein n=1 Tax=Methylobacterium sp. OAE515 TaxID=2817895 RepID=UPI00178B1477